MVHGPLPRVSPARRPHARSDDDTWKTHDKLGIPRGLQPDSLMQIETQTEDFIWSGTVKDEAWLKIISKNEFNVEKSSF